MTRLIKRILQIITATWRFIVAPRVLPWLDFGSAPVRVRKLLEGLGGTWIKLGQALALRFDVIPPEYCREFFNLLNQVEPFSTQDVRRIIYEDFGAYPEDIFCVFEPEPFAAASIGQVHRARLPSGEKVAVKVQRPNIDRLISADVTLMHFLADIVDFTHIFGATRMGEIVDEFARWTERELDYEHEARHAYMLRQNAEGDPRERNPEVYFEFVRPRVLTTEFIEGIPLIDIMYALQNDDLESLESFQEDDYDLEQIARNITWNVLNQVYQHGYFHADLHPANLFVLPGNEIGYVDFGIVGNIKDEVRESLAQYAWHLFRGDVDRATEEFMRWISPSEVTDVETARSELKNIIDDYLFDLHRSQSNRRKSATSTFEAQMMNTIRRHRMRLEPEAVLYFKALITADAVVYELVPDFDLAYYESRFFTALVRQETREALNPHRLPETLFGLGHQVRRSLDVLESLGTFPETVEETARRVRRRIQVFAMLLLVVGGSLFLVTQRIGRELITNLLPFAPQTVLIILVIALVSLVFAIIYEGRRLPKQRRQQISGIRRGLRRRWELGR